MNKDTILFSGKLLLITMLIVLLQILYVTLNELQDQLALYYTTFASIYCFLFVSSIILRQVLRYIAVKHISILGYVFLGLMTAKLIMTYFISFPLFDASISILKILKWNYIIMVLIYLFVDVWQASNVINQKLK